MERLSDNAIEIINELHTERLDYTSEYLPLIDAAQRLAHYEDLEEQGRLVELPCKVGDEVFVIHERMKCAIGFRNLHSDGECDSPISCMKCMHGQKGGFITAESFNLNMLNQYGKTVFLSRPEAEAALAESGKEG